MLPRIIMHNAVSLDGRITGFTPDLGLYYGLASRWSTDAMLSGSNTILAASIEMPDEPEEPHERVPNDPRPLLVVPDSRGRISNWHMWQKAGYWRDVVVLCSTATKKSYLDYLERRGIDVIIAGDDHVDIRAALEELNARYGVQTVRLDTGGTLNGVLLRAGLIDEVSVLVHPELVGSAAPGSLFHAPETAEGTVQLHLDHCERLPGDIVWLRYTVMR
jgi:2,5-diamino-6-(ribosylamino)-4(3H)-pyrimidinone 5'-phosphate reductase